MLELCCKFQIRASNTVGQCDIVKICMSFKGAQFCNNDPSQNSVSFVHNACLNCVASFKSLHQILLEELFKSLHQIL